jgi:hypothetical protein
MAAKPQGNNTPSRPIRISEEDWTLLGRAAGFKRRSKVIGEFIAWYTRQPRAVMPVRPDRADWEPEPAAKQATTTDPQ